MPPFFSLFKKYAIAAVVCLLLCFCSCKAEEQNLPERIIHGGGILWEVDSGGCYRAFAGSNSREALVRCAESGMDFVELDFSMTSDGELVCIHGWSREYIAGTEPDAPLALDEFRQSRIYGCFTPMTARDAAEILRQSDMTLVADIKDSFEECAARLAEVYGDMLDRVVIQIYDPDQYKTARDLGFDRISYTLYRLEWEEKLDTEAHIAFAEKNQLQWIAFSAELLSNEPFLEKMLDSGVPLYVHTVNDEKTVQYLLDIGITGVYTDNIN